MQRIKEFFTGRDAEIRIAFIIAGIFLAYVALHAYERSTLTQEERTAAVANRILEIHPEGQPTIVCFVLDNPGRTDSISCVKK